MIRFIGRRILAIWVLLNYAYRWWQSPEMANKWRKELPLEYRKYL